MARQSIPPHPHDLRAAAAPHLPPLDPFAARTGSPRAAEADDYARGTVDDYDWDEDQAGHVPPRGAGCDGGGHQFARSRMENARRRATRGARLDSDGAES